MGAPEVSGSIANDWKLVSYPLVRTTIIIIVYEARDAITKGIRIILRIDIDILLLDCMPETLYPDIVFATALPSMLIWIPSLFNVASHSAQVY